MTAVVKNEPTDTIEIVALPWYEWLKARRLTLLLASVTLIVLVLSVPGSLRADFGTGGLYLFSRAFVEDIPRRLSGPGRFRFVLQPLIAIILGVRSGRSDARAGRPAYLYGLLFHRQLRREFLRSSFETVINLILMGILMDAVSQWFIFGVCYPGAALVVGPLLILLPYSIARALTNRGSQMGKHMKRPG